MPDKFYCPLPFVHQFVCADGIAMCCRSMKRHDMTIQEFEDSEYLKSIRQQLIDGEIPNECKICHEEELRGQPSIRTQALEEYGTSRGPELQFIDLRHDNLCNLACRMCNSSYSSLWAREVDTHPELRKFQKPFHRNNVADKILGDFDSITCNLTKLSLTGGEPLLIKDHLTVLEKLLERGRNDVELTITSNITALNPRWFDVIKEFKTVHWTVSLDEVGEYIRWPYNWTAVNNNLQTLLTLPNSIAINCTLTVYSLLNIDELVEYFLNLKPLATGPFELWFSVAEFPPALSVSAIPSKYRSRIKTKLEQSIEMLKLIPEHKKSIQVLAGVLNTINTTTSDPELVEQFWEYTYMLDQQRNQNFHTTFDGE